MVYYSLRLLITWTCLQTLYADAAAVVPIPGLVINTADQIYRLSATDQPGTPIGIKLPDKLDPQYANYTEAWVLLWFGSVESHDFTPGEEFVPADSLVATNNGIVCDNVALNFKRSEKTFKQTNCYGIGMQGSKGGEIYTSIPTLILLCNTAENTAHQIITKIPVVYTIAGTSGSVSTGDPHFYTPDGNYFDYQDLGWMWLFRSKYYGVFVQTRQYSCSNYVTCMDTVVVQYEDTVVVVAPWNAVKNPNGPGYTMPFGKDKGQVAVYTYALPNQHGFNVNLRFDNGFAITITNYFWFGKSWYMVVNNVFPPNFRKKKDGSALTGGLVGQIDGNPGNDFIADPTEAHESGKSKRFCLEKVNVLVQEIFSLKDA
ncbi:hypothetical protein BDR26DRAFT_897888 [Obelidium mucronatum]|nr:hypothetical protein BDR26DRAFT_897888 [Obelidium mucronatum]